MQVLVGLGNPGSQHSLNRHNIGFMVVDTIAQTYDFPSFSVKSNLLISEKNIHGQKTLLIKPTTYMNLSGRAVQPVMAFYKLSLDQLLVVHDDLDLDFGRIKLKQGGGDGGHNGLKSLDQCMGKEYWRLRIGISHPGHKDAVSGYVLSNFSKDEQDALITVLSQTARHYPDYGQVDHNTWLSRLVQDIGTL
jgi:peptidyl-tRNA hydrolase, PTH1 family